MVHFKDICSKYTIPESSSALKDQNGNLLPIETVLGSKIMKEIENGLSIDPMNENKNSSLVFTKVIEAYRKNNPKNSPLLIKDNVFGLNLRKFMRGDYKISTEFSNGNKFFDLFSPDLIIRDKSIKTEYNPKGTIVGVFNQKGRTSNLSVHQSTASIYEIFDLLLLTIATNVMTGFIHQNFKEKEGKKTIKYNITMFNPCERIKKLLSEIEDLLVESVYYRYARKNEIIYDVYNEYSRFLTDKTLTLKIIKQILSRKLNEIEMRVEKAVLQNDLIYDNGGNKFRQLFSKYKNFSTYKANIMNSLMEGVLKKPNRLLKMNEDQFRGEWQRNILRDDLLVRFKERIRKIRLDSKGDN